MHAVVNIGHAALDAVQPDTNGQPVTSSVTITPPLGGIFPLAEIDQLVEVNLHQQSHHQRSANQRRNERQHNRAPDCQHW